MMPFRRIHILGGAGSGKTTLARKYSAKFSLPHQELDEIYYLNAAERKLRPKDERDEMLTSKVAAEAWVMDGIFWQPWVEPIVARADKIIVLAVPEMTRHFRVVKRHIQLVSKAPISEYSNFFPTLIELLKHNRIYNQGPLKETLEVLREHESKVSVCISNREAEQVLGL